MSAECGHPVPSGVPGLFESSFDGIAEVWFDSAENLRGTISSDTYMANVRTDGAPTS